MAQVDLWSVELLCLSVSVSADFGHIFFRKLDAYCEEFKAVKGMRTLEWKHNLGMVELELELAGKTLAFSVTPPRATAIYHFQEKSG